MVKTILVFLIIFSIMVVYHEFGHFYFAKKAGIRVREFAIGMGPKLFAKQDKSGTTYTIRMLPLGGYVRLAGLNEEDGIQPGMQVGLAFNEQNVVTGINLSEKYSVDEMPAQVDAVELIDEMTIRVQPIGQNEMVTYHVDENAVITEQDGTRILVAPRHTRYESATPWNKIKTNIAGPINNFILAIVTFMIIGLLSGGVATNQTKIGSFVGENSPAQAAGLKEGDVITAVDGTKVTNWDELAQAIQAHPGKTVPFEVNRENQVITVEVAVESAKAENSDKTYGRIGIARYYDTSIQARLLSGFTQTWAVIAAVITTLLSMFKSGFDINQFGGPVAMAQMTNTVVEYGFIPVLSLMAMLSANLGIINLLPIPALDGGKIVLNLYEAVRGKPLAQEKEGIITLIGVGLLVILMIAVTWNDIIRAFF
ncbi:RIP metalloprotease RseP [Aerococcaceae bacterium zg-ZJ1578]|uniref:RIP metalloprotease RseP n=1 Tax=Aerococcaceae bacterium zg-252 TaxID=2796928 RepID=UPI001A313392|nr:RIP metalloprotease RseP [Aerococcaceae bacterium zg-1578]